MKAGAKQVICIVSRLVLRGSRIIFILNGMSPETIGSRGYVYVFLKLLITLGLSSGYCLHAVKVLLWEPLVKKVHLINVWEQRKK